MDDKFQKKWIEDWIDQNSGGALKINEGDLVRSSEGAESHSRHHGPENEEDQRR
jgi:hypothetical protein